MNEPGEQRGQKGLGLGRRTEDRKPGFPAQPLPLLKPCSHQAVRGSLREDSPSRDHAGP